VKQSIREPLIFEGATFAEASAPMGESLVLRKEEWASRGEVSG
jgi:hypothetical protein